MKRQVWSRWGRGSCEGYGFDVGDLLRFSVVAEGHSQPNAVVWKVTVNTMSLGEFGTFEEAIQRAEWHARRSMALANEDLQRMNGAPPAKRRQGRNRR